LLSVGTLVWRLEVKWDRRVAQGGQRGEVY